MMGKRVYFKSKAYEVDRPLLSVCIPAYNRPLWLGRALNSILSTNYEAKGEIEIVVSDDSTNSECGEISQAALNRWEGYGLYTHNQPSLGMARNWNHSVKLSSGTYIIILHDDDFLVPNGIETILKYIKKHEDSSLPLLFGSNIVNEKGKVIKRQRPKKESYIVPEEALKMLLYNSSFIRFPAIVIPQVYFREIGLFDEEIGSIADIEMWIRILGHRGFFGIPEYTCSYTVHSGALTTKMFNEEIIRQLLSLFSKVQDKEIFDNYTLKSCKENYFHQFILAGTYRNLRKGEFTSAAKVMSLFNLNGIYELNAPWKWKAIRMLFQAVTSAYSRCPAVIQRLLDKN